jgi:PAS domain S-box-containing protein
MLLVGMASILVLGAVAVAVVRTMGWMQARDARQISWRLVIAQVTAIVAYVLNRHVRSEWTGSLLCAALIGLIVSIDEPQQLIAGRIAFLLAIPILGAGIVVRSWASFVAAGLSSIALIAAALGTPSPAGPAMPAVSSIPAVLGPFTVAFVAWLGARSMQQALQTLRVSEARYRAIVEDQSELICRFRPDGTITFINEPVCRYFGLEGYGSLVGRDLRSLMASSQLQGTDCGEFFAAARSLEPEQRFDCSVVVEGQKRWLRWSGRATHDERGQVIERQVTGRDVTAQVETERKLRESRALYRSLVETSPDAIALVGLDGTIMAANQRLPRLHGFESLDEMRAHGCLTKFDVIAEQERPLAEEDFQRLLKEGMVQGLEYHGLHRDGTSFPIEVSASIVRDASGRPCAYMAVSRDVTRRVQAEQTLRESEEKYRALVEHLPDVVVRFDREYRHLYVSPSVRAVVDLSPLDLTGKTHRELGFPSEQAAYWERSIQKVFDSGQPLAQRLKLEGAHGKMLFDWHLVPEFGAAGNVQTVLSVAHDITEQVRAEEWARRLVQSVPIGMHMYELSADGELRFTGANPAADEILGVDNRRFIGKVIEDAFPSLAETGLPQVYRRVASEGATWHTDQITYEQGQIAGTFEVHAFQVFPDQMVAAFQDITERTQTAEALRGLYLQVENAREEERRRLAKRIHDDIVQPLVALVYQVALLDVPEAQADALSESTTEISDRCRGIMRDLHPPVLGWPLEDAVHALDTRRTAMEVNAQIDPDIEERQLPADQKLAAYRVIQEAVNNAVNHSGATKVVVNLSLLDGQGLRLEVIDDGCGFDPSTARKVGHYGMTFMRERLRAVGGSMEIQSQHGTGTRISATIPLAQTVRS